jgi:hypothetical protein
MGIQDVSYKTGNELNAWPKRPFLTILYKPRSTIRAIVDTDPKIYLLLLASLAGIARMLNFASRDSSTSLESGYEIASVIFIVLVGGSIVGIISCYIGSFFLRRVSNLLGGVSTSENVRAAFVWSSGPLILLLLFWALKIALYGVDIFNENAAIVVRNPVPYVAFSLIELVFEFWAMFLFWKCLAEVNRFSIWKSILTQIIVGILLVLVIVVIQLAYSI